MRRIIRDTKASKSAGWYLNVDLEVRSRSDLTPLVEDLSRSLSNLHAGRIRSVFFASFEAEAGSLLSPDVVIARIAAAVSALRPATRKLWREARDRVFDIGVESLDGTELFALALRTDTLKTIAKLNARLAFSLYPTEQNLRRKAKRKSRRAS